VSPVLISSLLFFRFQNHPPYAYYFVYLSLTGFVAQGAQLFGGTGGMDFMNMAALMGANGGAGAVGASMGMPGGGDNGAAFMGMVAPAVTPRGSDAVSMAGSSMAGSMS